LDVYIISYPSFNMFFGFHSKNGRKKALRDDFKNTLNRIELQVNLLKVIEERISHRYLETIEIPRIKREK
jgi:hypothetical protein